MAKVKKHKTTAMKTAKRTAAKRETPANLVARVVVGETGGGGGGGGVDEVRVTFVPELVVGTQVGNDVRVGTNARLRITATVESISVHPTSAYRTTWKLEFTPPGGSPSTRSLENHGDGDTMIREFVANDLGKYRVTMTVKRGSRVVWEQWFQISAVAISTLQQRSGRLTFLRVHEGGGFGPPDDRLDGDVIVKLDTLPDMAFGFALRNDGWEPVHRGMLELMRSAFEQNTLVTIDYAILDLKRNGTITRVALSK